MKFGFDDATFLQVFFLFHRIEKQISRRRSLEHLESSGTKVYMNGPVVHKVCEGRNRETEIGEMNYFKTFSDFNGLLMLAIYYLAKDSRHTCNRFGAY